MDGAYTRDPPIASCVRTGSASATAGPPGQISQQGSHVGPGVAGLQARERADGDPGGARGVVGGLGGAAAPVGGVVEVHHGETPEALDVVRVPVEAEPVGAADAQAGLFAELAAGGGFERFSGFDEAARRVEVAQA